MEELIKQIKTEQEKIAKLKKGEEELMKELKLRSIDLFYVWVN